MIDQDKKPIIIVGGGLGGLTLAALLGQQGQPVHVLEQASEVAPIGYGIQLGPNVFDTFDRLGISSQVKAAAWLPTALTMFDSRSGGTLLNIPLRSEAYGARFRNPYVVLHRADIHEILLGACRRWPGVKISVNANVTGFEDMGGHVRVSCEDGRVLEGQALIGADGLRSFVRTKIVDDGPPCANGYLAHRTILDMKDVPKDFPNTKDVVLWSGPGYHMIHYPLRDHTLLNVAAIFRHPAASAEAGKASHQSDVDHVYANAHPALRKLLSMMDLERRWVIADRDPVRHWSRGRVTLMGDAAHPTFQSYAQGAGMAIEDAGCLAELLQRHGSDCTTAFTEFSRHRLARTARVQLGSRALWEFYHHEGIAREARDAELLERTETASYDCVDWIWQGDPMLRPAPASLKAA